MKKYLVTILFILCTTKFISQNSIPLDTINWKIEAQSYILEQHKIIIPEKIFQPVFWLMNIGVILTFGISLLWMKPNNFIYLLSGLGSFFQLIAFFILATKITLFKAQIKSKLSLLSLQLLKIVSFLFLVKLIFQLLGSTPYFANAISSNWSAGISRVSCRICFPSTFSSLVIEKFFGLSDWITAGLGFT